MLYDDTTTAVFQLINILAMIFVKKIIRNSLQATNVPKQAIAVMVHFLGLEKLTGFR